MNRNQMLVLLLGASIGTFVCSTVLRLEAPRVSSSGSSVIYLGPDSTVIEAAIVSSIIILSITVFSAWLFRSKKT